jgi:excisionase family DNA binding protein
MKPTTRIDDETNLLDPLLTLAEVAKILRCSQRTVRRLIRSGRLKAVQTGRCYRFRQKDLAELIAKSLTT